MKSLNSLLKIQRKIKRTEENKNKHLKEVVRVNILKTQVFWDRMLCRLLVTDISVRLAASASSIKTVKGDRLRLWKENSWVHVRNEENSRNEKENGHVPLTTRRLEAAILTSLVKWRELVKMLWLWKYSALHVSLVSGGWRKSKIWWMYKFLTRQKDVRNSMRDERENHEKRQTLFFRERNIIA